MNNLVCWKCGAPLREVIMPMSRREVCPACEADQHVCKMCSHYDPALADACEEDQAEPVSDKENANFCDYFLPGGKQYRQKVRQEAEAAKAHLAQLFGDDLDSLSQTKDSQADGDPLAELERLFSGAGGKKS